ncbi:DUF4147 domain-containing protein, partial [Beggiatoa alba]|nr:DUF4147 domain-containing protein [Beggiatoa alba]
RFDCYESSHPVPSEMSLIAGQKMIDFITDLPEQTHLIFLVSGGASALVEKTKPGIQLEALIQVNHWLLASGLAIEEMNRIRQRLSVIKGGGLAEFSRHLKVSNLLLSDVSSNDPAIIGSGLFVTKTENTVNKQLPDWLELLLAKCDENKRDNGCHAIFTDLLATNSVLLDNIATLWRTETQCKIFKFDAALSGDIEQVAEKVVSQITEAGFYIWGGETTVRLNAQAGQGGRNQHLGLLIANKIKGMSKLSILCIGTDGTDGNTCDAGALVDGESIERGEVDGLNANDAINTFNSSDFLHASGDVINTGPTGTNVMDVVLAYQWE